MSIPPWFINMRGMSREDQQMKVRLPADLKQRIEEAAGTARRSLNAEIVARLQESFEPREPVTVRINLTANEETKMKDIQAALELLKPGIEVDQGIELVVAKVQKG